MIAKSRGFDRFKRTVIRNGKAYKLDAPEPFRTSLKGGTSDLLSAIGWGKKQLKRAPRKPRVKKSVRVRKVFGAAARMLRRHLTRGAMKREFPGAEIAVRPARMGGKKTSNWTLNTRDGGRFTGTVDRQAVHIATSLSHNGGNGVGSRIYRGLANVARRGGKLLASDKNVSRSAQRRYRGLAREGHDVFVSRSVRPNKHDPLRRRIADGPVFTVKPKGSRASLPRNYRRVFKARITMSASIAALSEAIEKARTVAMRLSPAQRRQAVTARLASANSALGFSRTRGGLGRSKLGPSKFGPKDPTRSGKLNQLSRWFADAKNPKSGDDAHTRKQTIEHARDYLVRARKRMGKPAGYKRGLDGYLKPVR